MDSKVVNKQIRAELKPLITEMGFERFSGRSFWRHESSHTDVINFQSFNSYNASIMGCTTYSFAVRLGRYILCIPDQYGGPGPKSRDGVRFPDEADCHFRGSLVRTLRQLGWNDKTIWYIDPEGRYLDDAISDVRSRLVKTAVPWFGRLDDSDEALRILIEDEEDMVRCWGFGNNPSPVRHYFTGYLAMKHQRWDIARKHLNAALKSECFGAVSEQLEENIEILAKQAN